MKKRILNWVKPAFVCLLCAVMLCEIGLTAFAESEGEVMLSNLAGQSGAYELNPITGEFEAAMHPEFFDMRLLMTVNRSIIPRAPLEQLAESRADMEAEQMTSIRGQGGC